MIGRLFESRIVRDPALSAWGRGDDLVSSPSTGGQRVTRETALSLLVVLGCQSLISDSIAAMPVDIMGPGADGRMAPAPNVPSWVEQPNPEMDRVDFVSSVIMSLLGDGNAFLAPVRDQRGTVAEVYVLDPGRVTVQRVAGRVMFSLDGKPVTDEIAMVRGTVLPGSLRGVSPIEAARQVIGLGLGAQDTAARFYAQGAVVPGVIQTSGNLTIEQLREIRDQWVASHGGSSKSHLPVVLTGDAKWQGISMTQEQAQFLESRRYTDAQIAGQLYRIDPSLLGIPNEGTSMTYQNVESRNRAFVQNLLPWMVRVERALSRLVPARNVWKFNVDGLLRADIATRYASYEAAARIEAATGRTFVTTDEMRAWENLGPLEQPAPPAPAQEQM